jgi:hypothetical protein
LFGALLGIGVGINEYGGNWQAYWNRIVGQGGDVAEVSHLWQPSGSLTPATYLKYKFLGIDPTGKFTGSAWIYGFWGGIAAYIFSKLPLGSKARRIQRPLGKIGKGLAAVSAVGALVLPGSPATAPVLDMPAGARPTGNVPFGRGQESKIV